MENLEGTQAKTDTEPRTCDTATLLTVAPCGPLGHNIPYKRLFKLFRIANLPISRSQKSDDSNVGITMLAMLEIFF